MITQAIVRKPCHAIINALTTSDMGPPDYQAALSQHAAYTDALRNCGLNVIELPADENFPDSTFVEDVALLTPQCAILTRPGAPSRTAEVIAMTPVIQEYYESVEIIDAPGMLDAGDILLAGEHYYIGLSGRTNRAGAEQLISILSRYGMTGSVVRLNTVLHLKTGMGYLDNGDMLVSGEFTDKPEFTPFHQIHLPSEEAAAANCLLINGTVLMPEGYPCARQIVEAQGYPVKTIDISEFEKIDGGISCLSLRF
ncbi:dimethylarginine dimethylaminohydrolase family protein [Aliamphritea hakodatensis]|uniref:dimethylarginine dimethylaminohydrolase family protein n=1 Tax=Aliamphritea hakodatensis TaxID=2895352 RepID=UPI0022FD949C|nr:N(G),N(G)-dimethylarginine dimethylaminohydrolase [Aliamphritea hakodatensis]